jgi:pimeloyl-ACP methyl ester carboxylesterase
MSLAVIATKSVLLKFLVFPLLAYIAICLVLFVAQRKLIYLSSRTNAILPADFEPWLGTRSSGSTELWGFKRTTKPSADASTDCLFFLHGNGGNASGWAHAVEDFPGDVFVLEYPGYGERPGAPTESSIKDAALRAFERIVTERKGSNSRIVVCGQSLGTGVTEAIFSRHAEKLHALVLVTPFLSLAEVAGHHYAWVPTRLLLRDRLHLYEAFLKFPGKSVIVTAADDEIIPRAHSLRYHSASNYNRVVLELPVTHNTISLEDEFWRRILSGEAWKEP